MEPTTIIEQLLFSTVRIETDKPGRTEAGTGFIFDYTEDNRKFVCLVTNKHVVADARTGRFFFTLSDGQHPKLGQRFDVQVDEFAERWHGHPSDAVDVTVMPLVPILKEIEKRGKQVFIRSVSHNLIPTEEQLNELNALEEVVFIGYPSGIYDAKNLMPIVRRGTTATPLQIDYEGEPAFLVDASVFPGSSGSPVLICNEGGFPTRSGFSIGTRVLFLGVISKVFYREEHGEIEIISIPAGNVPVSKTKQMIDLGIVYKSRTVLELATDVLSKLKS